ncbi:MAG TPA: alpha-glucosidase, partial [Acetobacteraceae bacterium]
MRLEPVPGGFSLSLGGRELIRHTTDSPFVFAGRGEERMEMIRGNFDISDYLTERAPLAHAEIDGDVLRFRRDAGGPVWLALRLSGSESEAVLSTIHAAPGLNRFWFRLPAKQGEHVWGCGEQMSYLDLRGRRFPLWTSEPGVGRDKTTAITFQADVAGRAGGDYCTTNYPQPSFLSSRRYSAHLETTAYSAFDFRHSGFHELEVWAAPERLELR